MAFSKWKNVPEIQEAVGKLKTRTEKYFSLFNSDSSEDRVKAQTVWSDMAASYWEILFALVDAKTQNNPEQLIFDDEEKLFIDLGCIPEILPLNENFDPKKLFAQKCAPDILPVMTFSDYIAESWAFINGRSAPVPSIGMSFNDRLKGLIELLGKVQTKRNQLFSKIAYDHPSKISVQRVIEILTDSLMPAMKVIMRVPEFREGDEELRQSLSQQRKAYLDAEKAALLFVSSACKREEDPLSEKDYERFMMIHNDTRGLAKKILYTQVSESKIARNAKKITDACAPLLPEMRRGELRQMIIRKREYLLVPAKNARCDSSFLCRPGSTPVNYAKDFEMFIHFNSNDMDMFNVPKVRMYGIPPVIFIPGQGLGTYDWSDHSFLIPSFPTIKEGQSIAYALGTFRWDTDEDRKVRAPYETIKENRKKSVMALATSFYKDYSIWMTKERLGYRVLSREAHKIFKHICSPKMDE